MAKIDGVDFTDEEMEVLEEAHIRETQLHNLQVVLNGSITEKKYKKISQNDLPGYITRNKNAQAAANKLMKKKGFKHG